MTQTRTYDHELADHVIRFGVLAADSEARKPGPASTVPNPDGSMQRETEAENSQRVIGAAITCLLEQGLLMIPDDAAERMDAGIPLDHRAVLAKGDKAAIGKTILIVVPA
jgi:hypothetical protein